MDHARDADANPDGPQPDWRSPAAPGVGFSSPHQESMPCLYADGSVRGLAYGRRAQAKDGTNYNAVQTFQYLFAWDDGVKVEAP
jgi:prepilin-type processing-associated H-X9-DG protein